MAKSQAPHEVNDHRYLKAAARWVLLALLVFAAIYFVAFDLHSAFTLENLKAKQLLFKEIYGTNPLEVIAIYFVVCTTFVVCCIPVAAIMMISAGALFGLIPGTLICSCALTLGAVLSFLASRFLLREVIERKFQKQAAFVNHGIERDGTLFLATMRLLPMMPFFITNLLLGLTKMPLRRFWWVSQLASLPTIALHANAGTALASLSKLSDFWSLRVFLSLLLLALFPLMARVIVAAIRSKKASRKSL